MLTLDVLDLPDGWTPLRSVSVIEALSEDGTVSLALRTTENAPSWVILGMLNAAADVIGADLLEGFIDDDDGDDGETSSG